VRQMKQNTPCRVWRNSAWRSISFQRWMPGHIDYDSSALASAIVVDNETGETRVVDATAIVFENKP
jgi:hypothetical protein